MSGFAELLAEAKAAGIRFAVKEGGKVEMRARQAPPPELVERLKAAKPALLVMLGAAPLEVPREWTDGLMRLRAIPCPAMLMPARWDALVADTARFLESEWAGRAAALGWDIASLFMCHARRPLGRFDCRGALWAINGAEIVALTAEAITVRVDNTGSRLACRRPCPAPGEPVVLAWELGTDINTNDTEPPDAA